MSTQLTTRPADVPPGAASGPVRLRLDSIDVLRGLIMVIMALDHVRDFFSREIISVNSDLSTVAPALFFTRWITHFCAPSFVFLAGTSAYLYGARGRSKRELSRFLWTRGLWLVVLELTVVSWAWHFDMTYPRIGFLVIWVLGVSMIVLAGLVHLSMGWIIGIGLAMLVGHNLLDPISFPQSDWRFVPWALLHDVPKLIAVTSHTSLFFLYPMIPWVGLMALGYGFGQIFQQPTEVRERWLIRMGAGMVAGFVMLRLANGYGEPFHWSAQTSAVVTLMAFLNCTKYPPSLLYLLMTLGPALLLLALLERRRRCRPGWLLLFGRVPLFFYLIHIYLIHLAAGLTAMLWGRPGDARWILSSHFNMHRPEGYGQPLWVVYLAWTLIVALLFLPCRWYAGVKQRSRSPWLSYL